MKTLPLTSDEQLQAKTAATREREDSTIPDRDPLHL